eukprot:CAMPEP_0181356886 /NCGR_PEP_ID=MMETSP1106-20121128/4661_1 /TAXON_ID=81844 /ORGANISM="Mantoniella antarctica, Strain SL-175" /LENGTH=35 /DNA_ID= /DNA_START= /DNA_END= /DNA_ORIENTATION=
MTTADAAPPAPASAFVPAPDSSNGDGIDAAAPRPA